jgi:hypothetical protein
MYVCSRCGGVVTAAAAKWGYPVSEMYPSPLSIDEAVPEPAREYLNQAARSLSNPAGCVMLCASAVDAMLKAKSYKSGSLYTRIGKALEDHLITAEMAQWAHEVRLDANEPRHADEESPLPTDKQAKKCIDFAMALAQFLFVLPSRVQRGLKEARDESTEATD